MSHTPYRFRFAKLARQFTLPLLAALAPVLVGVPLMLWQAERELVGQTQESFDYALRKVESIFDYAETATHQVRYLVGAPCKSAVFTLRQQSMATPFVRSLNLVRDGQVYCTSLEGARLFPEQSQNYSAGRLRLMAGNLVTPERALIVFRLPTPGGSVLAGIDGQYVVNALQLTGNDLSLSLQIGDYQLDADGSVSPTPWITSDNVSERASSRYPFRLRATLAPGSLNRTLESYFLPILGLLILCGTLVFWLMLKRRSPTEELERALRDGEFVPYYQPIVDADADRWDGAEVLVRWRHPVEGVIPPDQFIPLAESSGLIVPLTQALMQQVRRELSTRLGQLPHGFHIGFNLSAAHCHDWRLLDDCREFLAAFPPGRIILVLELTEREPFRATPHTFRLFERLREMGILIALDDFGTGSVGLDYLRHFRVDSLKVDRSYVAMADEDVLSQHLFDNIVDLAQRLSLTVIAEGVETPAQNAYLRDHGVHHLQGYLYARPAPLRDMLARLKSPPSRAASESRSACPDLR
ncbi:cyclic diguanylate phosphodiesterase [Salinicola endophyticus]|uniref:cyclic-guanylate-specific phosphodiesterase n=1 Tax=Salinicola endophyticus TaxID=1949083 RepID=A0ABY8FFJ6_9GAMM|nr:EAL domain-containing protein [Salinicola endophyticus]WFF41599.1 cyclic diguanylate phosphodiesterase [Salinicola endophyticus]